MEFPFYTKALFYGLVIIAFAFLMSFMKKGIENAKMDRETGARFQWRVMLVLFGWMMFLAMAALGGFFLNFDALPPRPAITIIGSVIFMVILLRNKTFHQIAVNVPLHWIPNFQFFRVPLETLLWLMMIENIIPVQMTFEGYNFDVVPALLGPVVGYLVFRSNKLPHWVASVWNVFGITMVVTIVVIATLSIPSPIRQFMNEPSNTMIAYFPFIWLPGFLVPMAIFMHLVNLKQIAHHRKNAKA